MLVDRKIRQGRALLVATAALSLRAVSAQQLASPVTDTISSPVIVRASSSAAQTSTDQFLSGFITTAARSEGATFISCVATAAKLRPDLAGKIVVCALNISRLNSHSPDGRLGFAMIDQIVKAAVSAAPESEADIVKAAIASEPY